MGAAYWALAALVLATWLLHRRGARHPAWLQHAALAPWRVALALLAAWLALAAGELALTTPADESHALPLALWMAALASLMACAAPTLSPRQAWCGVRRRLTRPAALRLVTLVGLTILALATRATNLEHIPANLSGDEGTAAMEALALLGPPLGNPFATVWLSMPTLSLLGYALSMRVLGESVAGLRTLSALAGAATVPATWLLARELWGRRVAWLAAVVLAGMHYHLHFSRVGLNNAFDGLVFALTCWRAARALRTGRPVDYLLAGMTAGLGWYGYFGARLAGPLVVAWLLSRALLAERPPRRILPGTALLLAALALAAWPLWRYFAAHPHEFGARARQVSVVGVGWLEREQALTGRSPAAIIGQQVWRAVSGLHLTPDPTFWYRPEAPLLDWLSGGLLVLGLVWAGARWRGRGESLLLLWFAGLMAAGWALTENPPSSQRVVALAPALAVLVALGLRWLSASCRALRTAERRVDDARRGHGWRRHISRRWPEALLLTIILGLNLHFYFGEYAPRRTFGNPTAELTTDLARYLATQGDDAVVYLHGAPYVYWDFGTLRFLAARRGVAGGDVLPEDEVAPPPDAERVSWYAFVPERLDEFEAVRARFPGGREHRLHSSADGRLMALLYEVRPAARGR